MTDAGRGRVTETFRPRPALTPDLRRRVPPARRDGPAANAQLYAELTTSRARIVAAADQTRRRIERNLHDGAQQRLVSLALQLQAAQATVPPEADELAAQLDDLAAEATSALDELGLVDTLADRGLLHGLALLTGPLR